jgi:hypothetical protein
MAAFEVTTEDPSCFHPYFISVTSAEIKMTEADIEHALLNKDGWLRRCNCGRVSEIYRDHTDELQRPRLIGEYDSEASPNKFTLSQSVLDEYLCMKANGRIRSRTVGHR